MRFYRRDLNPRTTKKVGNKPKRGERVYKRKAKAQSDLFRKSRRKRYAACGDVAKLQEKDISAFRRRELNSFEPTKSW